MSDGWGWLWNLLFEREEKELDTSYDYKEERAKERYYENKYKDEKTE